MPLPYESSTSGERALGEIQKLLRGFGCSKFGSMVDDEAAEIMVQFEYRGRPVSVKASIRGYAAAWLRQHPHNPSRMKATRAQHERKAFEIASSAVYSILRDWIKGQITAIETTQFSTRSRVLLRDGSTAGASSRARPAGLMCPRPSGSTRAQAMLKR